ncbi:MAG TPA: hypothetical protein VM243_15840 [Phycisphaerae bacterium]|nr:hypothetical protein [Phycisphaerae bacterium]
MRRALLCLCCLGLVASFALADKPTLQKAELGKKIDPLRMGRMNADGTVDKWIDFDSQPKRGANDCLVFDCFESDGAMPGYPTGFDTCGREDGSNNESGGSRWYFGPTYRNCYATNDMEFDPAYGGRYIERMEWGWKWYVNGSGTGENLKIIFETFEDFDETCQTGDPNGQGEWLGGVVFDYGYQNCVAAYYLFSDSEEQLYGMDWVQLPADGAGSYNIWILSWDDADPNELYIATMAQPMLWGTGTNEWINIDCIGRGQGNCPGGVPPDGTTSHQGIIQWDDDNPYDAWHTAPDECYDNSYGVCPDPFGVMWSAYIGGECGEGCVGDIDGDGDTDHSDLGELLSAWGSRPGDPNWNPNADLDGNGEVGHSDLGIVLSDWGCVP